MTTLRHLACVASSAFLLACGAADEHGPAEDVEQTTDLLKNARSTSNNRTVVKVFIDLDGNDGAIDSRYEIMCSGQVVARDTVVTSAHCLRMNVPNAAARWWTGSVPVAIELETATSGGEWKPLTVDSQGIYRWMWATVRVHPNFQGFVPGDNSGWQQFTVGNDVATLRFDITFPGFTSASQVPWLLSTESGTTTNGDIMGYGETAFGLQDTFLRQGSVSGTRSGSVFTFNSASSATKACPGDNGAPLSAGNSLGIPRYTFGLNSLTGCGTSANQAAHVASNVSFITGAVPSTRCVTQTFTAQTPPPQGTTTLRRCF